MLTTLSDIGMVIDFLGKLLVSYTAVAVHYRFWKEHKMDEKLFREMHKEQYLGIVGIVLMTIGFTLEMLPQMYSYFIV